LTFKGRDGREARPAIRGRIHGNPRSRRSIRSNRIDPPNRAAAAGDLQASTPARDRAEISEEARLLNKLAEVPDVRMDRVAELRELIASGRYETPERIAKTVEKLLEEI
jgi:flagellar biosynthesis anti-sigma factor FlgM